MSQPTDAEIAGKLDGMEVAGIKSTNYKDDWVELDYGSLEWMKAPASNLIDYCRAVVERVDGGRYSVEEIIKYFTNFMKDGFDIEVALEDIKKERNGIAAVTAQHRKEQG